MRTTLNVRDGLFEELLELTGARTKTEAVRIAIEGYVRQRKLERLVALRGRLEFDESWRELRELENREHEDDYGKG